MNFVTSTAGREYLLAAPPYEVLRILDDIAQSPPQSSFFSDTYIPEALEVSLLARNERLVDLGLVRVCRKHETLIAILARRRTSADAGLADDPEIVEAALSNTSCISNLSSSSRWLESLLPTIAESGNHQQLAALFQNPKLSRNVLEALFENKPPFSSVPMERRHVLLRHALQSPMLVKPFEESPHSLDGWDAYSDGRTRGLAWALLLREEPCETLAYILADCLPKIGTFVVHPWEVAEQLGIDKDSKDYGKAQLRFLQVALERWQSRPSPEDTKYSTDKFALVREAVAEAIPTYRSELRNFLKNSSDQAARRGYYRIFDPTSVIELEEYAKKDGQQFLEAGIHNPRLFNPNRLEIAACFYEFVYHRAKEFVAEFEEQQWLRSWYDGALRRLHNAHPLTYPDRGDVFHDLLEAKTSTAEQPTENASEAIQNKLAAIENDLRGALGNVVDSSATNQKLMNAVASLAAALEKQEQERERQRAADDQQRVHNAQQLQRLKVLLWIVLGGIAWILLMR